MPRPLATGGPRKATTEVRVVTIDVLTNDAASGVDGRAGAAPHERRERLDRLATEEPLQILAGGPMQDSMPIAVTMRTPGHDFELATGFLVTEGVLRPTDDVRQVKYCEVPRDQPQLYNVVTVRVARVLDPRSVPQRDFTAGASCGICGTTTLDDVEKACAALDPSAGPVVDPAVLVALPDALRRAQAVFDRTGGLHAAGLFTADGTPIVVREDVGRHNALDKVVGWALLGRRLPLAGTVLTVSGRASFEIVQKAAIAGIPVIAAVSAPSSLAVDAARRLGVTLVGFLRGTTMNVYSHPERIGTPEGAP